MDAQQQLLARIEAFLATRKMAETTFGRLAVNDGKFVGRLRNGSNMTLATLAKADAFLAASREGAGDRVVSAAEVIAPGQEAA